MHPRHGGPESILSASRAAQVLDVTTLVRPLEGIMLSDNEERVNRFIVLVISKSISSRDVIKIVKSSHGD
jgi:hypothetical protein